MERNTSRVKPARRYDSSRRREQAERTRQEILAAAGRQFLEAGYAATTVASIARAAGVSVETVYKAFGGKAGLVRAMWERALAGRGPVPAQRRSDAMRTAESDPRRLIEAWGMFTAEIGPLVVPVILLVRTAATSDPDMAELLEEIDAARLRRMEENARHLLDRGHLREGISLEHARDVLWLHSSPEMFDLLVLRRGWSPEDFGRFVGASMIAALL